MKNKSRDSKKKLKSIKKRTKITNISFQLLKMEKNNMKPQPKLRVKSSKKPCNNQKRKKLQLLNSNINFWRNKKPIKG